MFFYLINSISIEIQTVNSNLAKFNWLIFFHEKLLNLVLVLTLLYFKKQSYFNNINLEESFLVK